MTKTARAAQMSPPAAQLLTGVGRTTRAELLIKAAHIFYADIGITMSPSKVSRLAREYKYMCRVRPDNGIPYWKFLYQAMLVAQEQQLWGTLRNPIYARAHAGYLDPTGETAVRNVVMRDTA